MDKALREFLEFEKDEQLFARKYNGVNYWQVIRVDIARAVIYKRKIVETNRDEKNIECVAKRIGTLLKHGLLDLKAWMTLQKQDLLYFDQRNYRYVDAKQSDTYFDYFEFEDKYSIQRCLYTNNGRTGLVRDYSGIGVSVAELVQGILYRLSKIKPKVLVDTEEDDFIIDICDKIYGKFKVTISANHLIQQVRDVMIHYKIYTKYYLWLLGRINPKAIIVVCHYDSKLFPLYKVAHIKHIPAIELQHGLICNHDAYNYADLSGDGKSLPDFLFTYGDFWNQYIQLPNCMRAISVGNPYLENRKRKYKNTKPDEKSIVFYSDEITGREQARFAIDFYQRNARAGYRIFFKFHPTEYANWEKNYAFLKEHPEIHIVPKEKDLYELLAGAMHHVSVASTVLFESSIFNVKRYIMIKPGWIQYIQPLMDIGLAKGFSDIYEFENLLKEDIQYNESLTNFIWKSEARTNGLETLEKIINNYKTNNF